METENGLCRLVLSTGQTFVGTSIGSPARQGQSGELVFSTAMVGYPETLTDPSYHGQILVFSYPLIGNYGVAAPPVENSPLSHPGFESHQIQVSGLVMGVYSNDSFHWESKTDLDPWMKSSGVPGISGIDTRHLVQIIRSHPRVEGRIEPMSRSESAPFQQPSSKNVLPHVSVHKSQIFGKGKTRIALLDFGVKWSLIRSLTARDCEVVLTPWSENFDQIDASGFLLSNGPGDPTQTDDLTERCRPLIEGQRPVLGVCLGHQILALASGAKTERLPFGHRGHNQPVIDLSTGRGYMTSQNHGYAVVEASISSEWEVWFKNLNDNSIEGIKHRTRPIRCVQFHPEAHSGPQETAWILENFVNEAKSRAT